MLTLCSARAWQSLPSVPGRSSKRIVNSLLVGMVGTSLRCTSGMGWKGPARSNDVSNPTPATCLHQGRNEIALLLSYTAVALNWREQPSTKVRSASPHQYEYACLGKECAFPIYAIRVIIAPLSTQVPSVGVYFGVPVAFARLHLQVAKRQKPAFRRGSANPRRRKSPCTRIGRVMARRVRHSR